MSAEVEIRGGRRGPRSGWRLLPRGISRRHLTGHHVAEDHRRPQSDARTGNAAGDQLVHVVDTGMEPRHRRSSAPNERGQPWRPASRRQPLRTWFRCRRRAPLEKRRVQEAERQRQRPREARSRSEHDSSGETPVGIGAPLGPSVPAKPLPHEIPCERRAATADRRAFPRDAPPRRARPGPDGAARHGPDLPDAAPVGRGARGRAPESSGTVARMPWRRPPWDRHRLTAARAARLDGSRRCCRRSCPD